MTTELSFLRHQLSTSVDSITSALASMQSSSDVAATSFDRAGDVATVNEDKPVEKVILNSNLISSKKANKESNPTTSETIKILAIETIQDV